MERSIDRRINIIENFSAKKFNVIGDPSQIQNALLNLGINARDAMPEGGNLTIATANVTLDQQYCATTGTSVKPGPYLEFSVADTGTGMTTNVQRHIFEPFYTTKGMGKGTGLGLAAVYGMVRNHNGSIHVYSQLEKGTVFKLYLPIDRDVQASQEEEKEVGIIFKGSGCVLVVDDETIVRSMAGELLSNLGYETLLAEDGVQGVELFKKDKERIDLVLLDMVMPRMNGRDTFFAMRNIKPSVKVLLTSGFSRDIEISDLVQKGACGFIQKPFRWAELHKKVSEAIGRHRDNLPCPKEEM